MKTKRLYMFTIGCQMNIYDSERITGLLRPLGYEPIASLESADLIIVNTCAIRAKAEQKLFSFLGRLAKLKQRKPDLTIGVGGCVAQQEGAEIRTRAPHVDFVFGTHAIPRLPEIIKMLGTGAGKSPMIDVRMIRGVDRFTAPLKVPHDGAISRFVTIMQGCDNFCTYCVVPYVRGKETSRPPHQIVEEIQQTAHGKVREIILLGQNVNSYGQKEGLCSFVDLLHQIHDIDGLLRIRFTTSHPKDLSEGLMAAFRDLDKLCPHIHLPVQSGSNKILEKMNRKYTRELYLEKIAQLKIYCPDIAISSDIIVGFPGETDNDFKKTMDLIKSVGFDSLFAFQYSDRRQTPSAGFSGKVPEVEKAKRLQKVLAFQNQTTTRKNKQLVGTVQPVLVEGPSKKHHTIENEAVKTDTQMMGRTETNKIVNFNQSMEDKGDLSSLVGRLALIKIEKAFAHSLRGVTFVPKMISSHLKGEKIRAA